MSTPEIGAILGVSKVRVSQLEKRALAKLSTPVLAALLVDCRDGFSRAPGHMQPFTVDHGDGFGRDREVKRTLISRKALRLTQLHGQWDLEVAG